MNFYHLLTIPIMIIVFMAYFPIYNHLVGELFPVLDAATSVLYVSLIKLIIGVIPLAIIFMFLWRVISAVTEPNYGSASGQAVYR